MGVNSALQVQQDWLLNQCGPLVSSSLGRRGDDLKSWCRGHGILGDDRRYLGLQDVWPMRRHVLHASGGCRGGGSEGWCRSTVEGATILVDVAVAASSGASLVLQIPKTTRVHRGAPPPPSKPSWSTLAHLITVMLSLPFRWRLHLQSGAIKILLPLYSSRVSDDSIWQ